MDNQQRGRLSSHGSRHTSPQPSPHNYNNGYGTLNPSVNPHSFADPFSSAQIQSNLPSGHDSSLYPHSQFNQTAFQGNQYPDQSIGQDYNPNDFLNTGDADFNQDFSYMNQSYNSNQQANVNPADLSKISSPEHTSPGSGLLSPEPHNSPGLPNASPASTNGQYHTPQHSRHASLDPSSAYGVEQSWQGMQFQQPQHRRLPSDQYSNASSHSPYLPHAELNESTDANRSPYLAAQNENTYGIESFNINEPVSSQPGSTYVSPRLMPQQGLGLEGSMPQVQDASLEMFQNQASYPGMNAMHMRNQSVTSEMGQADQFAMPTINIEPAPVSRQQSFGPQGEPMSDGLSPPNSRGRNRSQSDTTGMTRPINSRSVSPSAGRREDPESLSVRSHSASGSISRESSPGVSSGRVSKDRDRRASTSSIHSRDYILDLADPGRPNASPNSGSSRVQKHPATFQCTLCPKKFTRAYNLRSHLRTHTDERPFVCTVCGKAFARQHDRKRHEGLHSGEKKFVCKGELNSQPGQTWGCGRRFARADALGRHFRSEAGRVCIKPLLDEEAAERRNKQLMEQQQAQVAHAQHQQYMQGGLQPVAPGMMIGMDPTTQAGGFALPAALMAQYPQLANLDWNAISQQNLDMDDGGDLSDVGLDDGGIAAGAW